MSNYKRLFIQDYNYIFFTIVTQYRIKILISNIELLREAFKKAMGKYDFEIFAIVVLEEHFHLILKVKNIEEYPKIIYSVKNYFSKKIDKEVEEINKSRLSESQIKRHEKGIWQRRYWEHTIRDEKDLYKHLDYIHYNPIKHGYVEKAKDWKYSSFKKFVRMGYYDENWCNFEDKNKIKQIVFE